MYYTNTINAKDAITNRNSDNNNYNENDMNENKNNEMMLQIIKIIK